LSEYLLIPGAWAKLVRAEIHLQTLTTETRTFLDSAPYGITKSIDYERSSYLFRLDRVNEPPMSLGPIVGDFVHNLRSSLDHLAWQLSLLRYGGAIPRRAWREISYPIAHTRRQFHKLRIMEHLLPEHIAFLERFQTGYRNSQNPLILLHDG
jgi:hypothetical protein